jgi:hypothetical protein
MGALAHRNCRWSMLTRVRRLMGVATGLVTEANLIL